MVATFYIDGQSVGNEQVALPRRARIAIAIRSELAGQGPTTLIVSEDIGDHTNNEAEYHALLRLLSLLSTKIVGETAPPASGVRICSDSEVLVKQLSGEYKVREERLRKLRESARETMDNIGWVRLEWVPREENIAGLWLEGKIGGRRVQPEELLSKLWD